MPYIRLNGLAKQFGPNRVVDDFSLNIPKGAFVSLLGPSGCGKTTVLRMVAGFESPNAGSIVIDEKDVTGLKPNQRNVGMVFQAYALFPNLTVAQNVAFGLKVAGRPRREIEARVQEMLDLIGLPDLGARYPFQLSGGQQQRVALARALAPRPRVLLLDEPLSALDAKIRVSLRSEIRAIQRELGITTIFVTHDQEEALSISDQVVVMNKGRAEQAGTPFEIYNAPRTRFVATFVGSLNVLQGVATEPEKGLLRLGEHLVTLPARLALPRGSTAAVAIRPENIKMGAPGLESVAFEAHIRDVAFLGSVIRIKASMLDTVVEFDTFNEPGSPPPAPGSVATVYLNGRDLLVLDP